jgi:hypothetical protein
MSPSLDAGVMGRTKLAALRTVKALALLENLASEAVGVARLQIDTRHFPSRFELQGRRKQCFRYHHVYPVLASEGNGA